MSFEEFLVGLQKRMRLMYRPYSKSKCALRKGQIAMNYLFEVRKDLATQIHMNLNLDPFYDDKLLHKFTVYLADNWSK